MANPEAGHPRMPGDFLQRPDGDAAGRARLLMINCGVVLISVAGSAIIHSAVESTTTSVAGGLMMACPLLVAFLLYLLGLSLVLAALVADQFPRAAWVGVAVARALQLYVFGGLGW